MFHMSSNIKEMQKMQNMFAFQCVYIYGRTQSPNLSQHIEKTKKKLKKSHTQPQDLSKTIEKTKQN